MRKVFLDHQTTTPLLPEVFEVMEPYFRDAFGSPSSLHHHGLQAREAVADARARVASMINAESPDNIIFTSGGTEAANLAVKGSAYAGERRGNHIVMTEIEHPSVIQSVEFLEKHGFTCTRVKVDAEGRVDPADIREALTDRTILIGVHHANHDIGTIQPLEEIARVANQAGIPLYVDAGASGGWLPIDVQAMGVKLLSLAPHRFYGPKGVGVLYRHGRARLRGLIHGGAQEGGFRAGTENVPAIVGAGAAASIALKEMGQRTRRTTDLQQALWSGIRNAIDYVKLNGPPPGPMRIGTNLNLSVEFVEGEGLVLMLDLQGIAVSTGPSCLSKSLKVSPVLSAIGVEHSLAQGSITLSPGKDNTVAEADLAVGAIARVVRKLREISPAWGEFQRGAIDSVIAPRQ
jgi:cysteine desulfurase